MDQTPEYTPTSKRTRRLIEQADKMASSGRLTPEEAGQLHAARSDSEVEEVISDIRVRHAGARLGEAVVDGSMSQPEADCLLDRLRSGEHPRGLRAHLAKLRPRQGARTTSARTSGQGVDGTPPDGTEQGDHGADPPF